MMKLHSHLLRDESGASVIELALAAPIFAALLIGMVDLSSAWSARLQLEQAAQRTIERIQRDGYDDTRKDVVQAEAAAAAGVATSAVTVESWLQCNNTATKKAFTETCATETEPYARFVQVKIQKDYTPLFKSKWAGTDGIFHLKATAGIRVQ